jgi:hypothetical protein
MLYNAEQPDIKLMHKLSPLIAIYALLSLQISHRRLALLENVVPQRRNAE